jgi:phosphoglycolate phosphatase
MAAFTQNHKEEGSIMNYSTILFDLDGTLTDPKLGITRSVQYALSKYNIIEEDLDKLEPFIGPPLANSFEDIYSFSKYEAKKAVEYYREYFIDQGMYENEIYVGIKELLEILVNQQRVLMVATSKPTIFAEKILNYFKIDHYFEFVCGSNLDGTMSDKTEIIKYILDKKNIEKNSTIMIGDRKHDIIGAHNNGIDSIGVAYGYGSEEELRNIKPTHYIKTVQGLAFAFS